MPEPLCYTCVYGELIFIDGEELYICHRYKQGGRIVEPQYRCPFYEREEDEEQELLEWEEEVIP